MNMHTFIIQRSYKNHTVKFYSYKSFSAFCLTGLFNSKSLFLYYFVYLFYNCSFNETLAEKYEVKHILYMPEVAEKFVK